MADFNTEDDVMAALLKAKREGLDKNLSPQMLKEAMEDFFYEQFINQMVRTRDLCRFFETSLDMDMTYIQACVDGFSGASARVVECHAGFVADKNKGDK